MNTIRNSTRFMIASLLLMACAAVSPAHAEVRVGVSDWTGWVAWYVAQDQGYFRKYGADVKLIWFANYSDSISALSTGQLKTVCHIEDDGTAEALHDGKASKVNDQVVVSERSAALR